MSLNTLLFGESKTRGLNSRVKTGWLLFTAVLVLILAIFSQPVRSQFDDSAVPVTVDFFDNTGENAVPVIVDGAYSSPYEQDMDAMGFETGSLYRQFLDRSTNRFSAIVSTVQKQRGNYLVASIASTLIAPVSSYAPGQPAAKVTFGLTGVSVPVSLHVVGAQNTRNGPFVYRLDIDGDGNPDIDATRYGILAKAGFSSLTPGGKTYFLVEVAVPMEGKYAFVSGRMASYFYTATGQILSISDGDVETSIALPGESLKTVIDASYVPIFIGIDVSNAIDLQKNGEVPVKIRGLAGLDLQTLDISSVRLRDASVATNFLTATGELGTYYTQGAPALRSTIRETGAGQKELTVWFSTEDMRTLGGFSETSLSAVLVCKTTGGKNLAGTTQVRF